MKKFALLALTAFPLTGYCLDAYDNVPAPSGHYFLNYTAAFTSDTFADQNSKEHKIDRVDVLKNVFRYANYFEVGGMPAIATVLVPVAKIDAFSSKDEGLGDIILGSGLWFYNTDTLHTSTSLFVQAPTGQYDASNPASVGSNVWKVTPGLNMAYTSNGYDLEASLKYNTYSKNDDTGLEPGDETLFEVYSGWAVGLLQYGLHYTMTRGTDAKLNGARADSSGVESDQVGASVLWNFASGGLSFEYFKDVDGKNTLLGNTFCGVSS